jgi:hypothetical protein
MGQSAAAGFDRCGESMYNLRFSVFGKRFLPVSKKKIYSFI